MTPLQRKLKKLTQQQRVVYSQICETNHFKATGALILSCRTLVRIGLIKRNPNSNEKHDYVLDGAPLQLPPEKLPSTKSIVDTILDEPIKHIPLVQAPEFVRPSAEYSNMTSEQHVDRWIREAVTPDEKEKAMIKVKCLQEWQMKFVMNNYQGNSAKQMAERLKVDVINVKIFCQANNIEPLVDLAKYMRKPKDSFHAIPESRKLRMKKVGYEGPQKKTA